MTNREMMIKDWYFDIFFRTTPYCIGCNDINRECKDCLTGWLKQEAEDGQR